MIIQNIRSAAAFFFRVFVVTLCFIVDVKVRADVVVEAIDGHVEFFHNDKLLTKGELSKLPLRLKDSQKDRDLDVQALEGFARFSIDEKTIAVESGSFFSTEKDNMADLSKGAIFISIKKEEKKSLLHLKTPQGNIEMASGDIYVEVSDAKTQVSVLSGSITLIDRAAKKNYPIGAGYSFWLGGLLATGRRSHPIRPEACELHRIMERLKPLMGWNEKEFESRMNSLTPPWKDAVLKVADDSQEAVDNDLKILNQILADQKKVQDKKDHEQAQLRKLFREKTTGVPGRSTEAPSELDRAPSSEIQ